MARPYGATKRKRVNLYIDEHTLTELQIFFFDPARGKAEYGALSELVNVLLKDHLRLIKEKARGLQSK